MGGCCILQSYDDNNNYDEWGNTMGTMVWHKVSQSRSKIWAFDDDDRRCVTIVIIRYTDVETRRALWKRAAHVRPTIGLIRDLTTITIEEGELLTTRLRGEWWSNWWSHGDVGLRCVIVWRLVCRFFFCLNWLVGARLAGWSVATAWAWWSTWSSATTVDTTVWLSTTNSRATVRTSANSTADSTANSTTDSTTNSTADWTTADWTTCLLL